MHSNLPGANELNIFTQCLYLCGQQSDCRWPRTIWCWDICRHWNSQIQVPIIAGLALERLTNPLYLPSWNPQTYEAPHLDHGSIYQICWFSPLYGSQTLLPQCHCLLTDRCAEIRSKGHDEQRPISLTIFSIAIQIWWKFCITLTSILIRWSLQNFVHGTTAVLSWHVENFVAIWWPATVSYSKTKFPSNLNCGQ